MAISYLVDTPKKAEKDLQKIFSKKIKPIENTQTKLCFRTLNRLVFVSEWGLFITSAPSGKNKKDYDKMRIDGGIQPAGRGGVPLTAYKWSSIKLNYLNPISFNVSVLNTEGIIDSPYGDIKNLYVAANDIIDEPHIHLDETSGMLAIIFTSIAEEYSTVTKTY
jgi:hypothetical protein